MQVGELHLFHILDLQEVGVVVTDLVAVQVDHQVVLRPLLRLTFAWLRLGRIRAVLFASLRPLRALLASNQLMDVVHVGALWRLPLPLIKLAQ